MTNFYTLLPGTDVLRSKIDVFTWTNPADENETERVELTVDNDGIFITSCSGGAREDMSIGQKWIWQLLLLVLFWKHMVEV
jgi:hypothetical protein